MQLTPAPGFSLPVHAYVLVLEQVARLAARADEVCELEQLPQPDRLS